MLDKSGVYIIPGFSIVPEDINFWDMPHATRQNRNLLEVL
jgi:hypothetical protein